MMYYNDLAVGDRFIATRFTDKLCPGDIYEIVDFARDRAKLRNTTRNYAIAREQDNLSTQINDICEAYFDGTVRMMSYAETLCERAKEAIAASKRLR